MTPPAGRADEGLPGASAQDSSDEVTRALDVHVLVTVTDGDGRIVDANGPFCAITGYSREELLGTRHDVLNPEAHPPGDFSRLHDALHDGRTWQGIVESRDRQGQAIWLQATVIPHQDAVRRGGFLMISTDVSTALRQRLAYEALVNPEFDIGMFAGIARVVAEGCRCRGAGIGRRSRDGAHLDIVGLWLDGQSLAPCTVPCDGTPFAETLCADEMTVVPDRLGERYALYGMLAGRAAQSYAGVALRDESGHAIGVLYVVDDRYCDSSPDEVALIRVAAERARAELLREIAAEKLRESEARMRFALEAGKLAMWERDFETDRWVYNDRWAEIRGYRQGEIVPEFSDFLPEDGERFRPMVEDLLAGRVESYEVDYRTPHRDGTWRWINARTRVMKRAADGRALRVVGLQMDIHARRLAEETAQANQQWLQLTIDASDLGMWDWCGRTDRITWSPRCASMLGYLPEELPETAKAWQVLNHPDDQPHAAAIFRAHVRGETPQIRVEIRCRAKDGRWVWLLSVGRVIARDENGRALRAVGIHQDISQLKNAELALRESEARLRAVVENAPVGIFLVDPAGEVLYCSPSIVALRGDELRGRHFYDWEPYVHPEDLPRVRAAWNGFLTDPRGVYDIEWRALLSRHAERWIRVRATAVREDGRIIGFAGALEDVTERHAAAARERELQRQLQHTQKIEAIGALTGGIAHDFNNSLATILGFATLGLERTAAGDKLGEYLRAVIQAAEHSRDLVRKMLDFSRSAPAADVSPLDVRPRIADALQMLRAVIPATVRITSEVDPALPPVQIDPTDLHQLLLNLALNARDAIENHGAIMIGVKGPTLLRGRCAGCLRDFDDSFVELAVSDTGCGIPAESLPRIFDPFYSTKEVGKGTGMGLAVVHGIAHRAGGHVLVESRPGAGTTMRILLKAGELECMDAAVAPGAPAAALPAGAREGRVLVVDDEPAIVRLLCEVLTLSGFIAVPYTDPRDALVWAESPGARFDALVTDQTMPAMTGVELAAAVRRAHPSLPVILCTGLADRVDTTAPASHCVDEMFLKPVPLQTLVDALKRLIRAPD